MLYLPLRKRSLDQPAHFLLRLLLRTVGDALQRVECPRRCLQRIELQQMPILCGDRDQRSSQAKIF